MTWSDSPASTAEARRLLDDEQRPRSDRVYELALYGLVRTGTTTAHRVLSAGYLNQHAQLLDTPSGGSHS